MGINVLLKIQTDTYACAADLNIRCSIRQKVNYINTDLQGIFICEKYKSLFYPHLFQRGLFSVKPYMCEIHVHP